MKLAVDVKISRWAWGDGDESHVLPGGRHELTNASADFVRAVGAAAASDPSVIEIVESDSSAKKLLDSAVESDAASRKALASAVKDGRWAEGNLEAEAASQLQAFEHARANGDDAAAEEAHARMVQARLGLRHLRGEL
jgi:hypothetical protein